MALREEVTARAESRVGTVIKGKWRLDSVLGVGGMAAVYAATHRNQNRVAIKMLHPEIALDQQVTARFLREGYVANAVGHPGAVSVLDDDVADDGSPFLVMELLAGETLEARWSRKGEELPVGDVLPVVEQLLDVLAAAHDKGVVHRDIKPENLFLTDEGRLKILDFGIARLREITQASAAATSAGSLLGTPAFMAPEQARGRWEEIDGRTDIWAVGATLFTLLSGAFVHQGETLQEQLILAATAPPRSILEVVPALPKAVASVVDRALAFERKERWPDARSMQSALSAAWQVAIPDVVHRLPLPSLSENAAALTLLAPPEFGTDLQLPVLTSTTTRALMRDRTDPPAPTHAPISRVGVVGAFLAVLSLMLGAALWVGWRTAQVNADRLPLRASAGSTAKLFQAKAAALRLRSAARTRHSASAGPTPEPPARVRHGKASGSLRRAGPGAAIDSGQRPSLTKHTFTSSQPAPPQDPNPFDLRH